MIEVQEDQGHDEPKSKEQFFEFYETYRISIYSLF